VRSSPCRGAWCPEFEDRRRKFIVPGIRRGCCKAFANLAVLADKPYNIPRSRYAQTQPSGCRGGLRDVDVDVVRGAGSLYGGPVGGGGC
jgi:hypothetical protein